MATAWGQILIFFRAIAVGAGGMALYDLFRMLRIAFRQKDWMVFLEDVLFFMTVGLITWFYLLENCDGRLRGFVFVGEGLGAVLYFVTLGRLVMSVARKLIALLQRLMDTLILRPLTALFRVLLRIFGWFGRGFRRLFRWLGLEELSDFLKKCKKAFQIKKIHLPDCRRIVYNLFDKGLLRKLFNSKQEVEKSAERNVSSDT